jgi:tetratricopeptide (TPR) repeat protein
MAAGTRLGHWQTPASITEELGAVVAGERCEVVYARSLRLADAQRFARDCDAHVIAGEQWLGAPGPAKIRAYLFADAAQKDALMGAADTYIAKPWRKEIYLQHATYPHPALGHEIVHVLAGSFARGPFDVAGRANGLWPNPGLIEGIAVAASPRESDLSPREWAKAMKDLGILPSLSRLFAFGFLGENSSTAYTVSGAFVAWVKDKHGIEALRAWYGGRELPSLVGSGWPELEQAWHADLDKVELPEAARAQARAKFDRPGMFRRRCPHVVDGCKRRADQLRSAGDIEGMRQQYARVLELDPGDGAARVTRAAALSRLNKPQDAKRDLEVLAGDESLPRHVRDRALEELGDLALASAEPDAAVSRYAEVMTRLVEEDPLRTLEVKMGAARDPRARAAVVALLVGDRGRPPDKVRAAELLGAWSVQSTAEGLPDYLLGRHYLGAGDFDEAAIRLDQALSRQLPIKRVQVEAERLRIVTACALSDVVTAQRLLVSYGVRSDVPAARREGAAALVERCKRAAATPGR